MIKKKVSFDILTKRIDFASAKYIYVLVRRKNNNIKDPFKYVKINIEAFNASVSKKICKIACEYNKEMRLSFKAEQKNYILSYKKHLNNSKKLKELLLLNLVTYRDNNIGIEKKLY